MNSALPRSTAIHALKRVHFNSLHFTVTVDICLRVPIIMLNSAYIITLLYTSIFYVANPSSNFDHIHIS
jgi:hypothetical protein